MAKKRPWVAYRAMETPYTRVSKFRSKSYIRVTPAKRIVNFVRGERGKYRYSLTLLPKDSLQIRQEAIEAARQSVVRFLEKNADKGQKFFFRIHKYPFHVIRENPLAAGAGADRMSTGMKKSFGKPIGAALQIKQGSTLFSIQVDDEFFSIAKKALQRASKKLPCKFAIAVDDMQQKPAVAK